MGDRDRPVNSAADAFIMYETYRQPVDNKYWMPAFAQSDSSVSAEGNVPVRLLFDGTIMRLCRLPNRVQNCRACCFTCRTAASHFACAVIYRVRAPYARRESNQSVFANRTTCIRQTLLCQNKSRRCC